MSDERGRPVMLTNGERRLLVGLCTREILALESIVYLSTGSVLTGPAKHQAGINRMRCRQYRRLILELNRRDDGAGDVPPDAPTGG